MERIRRLVSRAPRRHRRLLIGVIAACLVAIAAGGATLAAFVGTAPNSGNAIGAGTVAIGDNDSGAMFTLPALKPNDTDTGCIKATFTGTLDSEVRLYG